MNPYTTLDLISNDLPTTPSNLFLTFIDTFRLSDTFVYKNLLNRSILTESYCLVVSLSHISDFSPSLYNSLISDPTTIVEDIENSLTLKYIPSSKLNLDISKEELVTDNNITNQENVITNSSRHFVVHFTSNSTFTPIRSLTTTFCNKLVRIRGIVVSATLPSHKPTIIRISCKKCLRSLNVKSFIPRSCSSQCGLDSFVIDPLNSVTVDVQTLKIQESFEDIPVGEMPRHYPVMCYRNLVDECKAGDMVRITGIVQMMGNAKESGGFMCLKVLGIEKEKKMRSGRFSDEEKNVFYKVSKIKYSVSENSDNNNLVIYDYLVSLFAPQIHGHEDIKKAILCLLFSGTRRSIHGTSLRPDLNILLIGDPGCAKSQLLKYTNLVSPGVYTSGKGSSAAGLTASVIRKKGGQFALEAGALVLSDMGVCCIDEFDKMDINDRVSIHEAMEQQTVSISKAGINTMLKTRCSVLAASNPIMGRYDATRSLDDNIDFGATVMSRFDCVFIVRDLGDKQSDIKLAKHIINIQSQNKDENKDNAYNEAFKNLDNIIEESGLFENKLDFMRKYISFAKSSTFPSLSNDSKNKLSLFYIQTRKIIRSPTLKITVRQLESMIRLSEALAKMELCSEVETKHVDEAIRIFTASTIQAASLSVDNETFGFTDWNKMAESIWKMIPIGCTVKYNKITEKIGESRKDIIGKAIEILEKSGKIQVKENGDAITRLY